MSEKPIKLIHMPGPDPLCRTCHGTGYLPAQPGVNADPPVMCQCLRTAYIKAYGKPSSKEEVKKSEQPNSPCIVCGFHFVSMWLPDGSAGLCGSCVQKAPSILLKLLNIVHEFYADTDAIFKNGKEHSPQYMERLRCFLHELEAGNFALPRPKNDDKLAIEEPSEKQPEGVKLETDIVKQARNYRDMMTQTLGKGYAENSLIEELCVEIEKIRNVIDSARRHKAVPYDWRDPRTEAFKK
jgi:hypothetical protein